jgi:hypothetical protein
MTARRRPEPSEFASYAQACIELVRGITRLMLSLAVRRIIA